MWTVPTHNQRIEMDWEGFEPSAPSILAAVAKEVRFRTAPPALCVYAYS